MELLVLLGGILFVGLLYKRNTQSPLRSQLYKFTVNSDTYYQVSQIDQVVGQLLKELGNHYSSEQIKKFKKALNKLNIIWYEKRFEFQGSLVLAVMENPRNIHIWIGPRVKLSNVRDLAYTGLYDQLMKLFLVSIDQEPNTDTPKIRRIIADVRACFI